MLEFKDDKIKYIEGNGIEYRRHPQVELDALTKIAITKNLINSRISNECFGEHEEGNAVCKKCWLSENGTCAAYKNIKDIYKSMETSPTTITVAVKDKNGEKLTMDDVNAYMSSLSVKEGTLNHKIAKIILESNNRSFGEVIVKIMEVCGDTTKIQYAKTRFYQVRKILKEQAGLDVKVLTQKYVHISKAS